MVDTPFIGFISHPFRGVIDFILSHLDDNNKLCLTQRQACKEIQAQELKEGRKKSHFNDNC
ncbi:hypothetical protein BGL58_04885 [Helicobacter pylori]|nr:hypothetical protein BGL58_04885 [Helicobacter pylori]